MRKSFIKIHLTSLILFFFFVNVIFIQGNTYSQESNQEELDELKKQKDLLQKNIDELNSKKEAVENEIIKEDQTQNQIISETRNLDQRISQSEFIIQNLQLDLEKINLDLQITKLEIEKIEDKISKIEEEIVELTEKLILYNNYLFKSQFKSQSILYENTTLEQNLIEAEKYKAILKMMDENIKLTKSLKVEVEKEREIIVEKKNELDSLAAEKEASTYQLEQQKIALASQKEAKLAQLSESEKKESELSKEQQAINNEISQYQVQLNAVLNALFLAPPAGARVEGGQVIGFQGRTGLSCNPIGPNVTRTNYYCQNLAGLSNYWYYYDPILFPSYGSHLHFSYFKNGAEIDPWNFIFGDQKSEFYSLPMDNPLLTQSFHSGHRAVDLVSYHGAPVYAVKPGIVRYYCDSGWLPPDFPDPGYGAIVYHDDGTRTAYWHLQKKAESPRGENCTF